MGDAAVGGAEAFILEGGCGIAGHQYSGRLHSKVVGLWLYVAVLGRLEDGQVLAELISLDATLFHLHCKALAELFVFLADPIDLDTEGRCHLTLTHDLLLKAAGVHVGRLVVQLGLQLGVGRQSGDGALCGFTRG